MRFVARGMAMLLVLVGLGAIVVLAPRAAHADPCAAPVQQIACENTRPGVDRASWDPGGQMDPSIVGFVDGFSVNVGEPVRFKVRTDAANYAVQIYRLGWYNGLGSRLVSTIAPSVALPQAQPECITDASLGLVDCGTWAVSATWNPPADAITGVYVARLVRTDTNRANLIPFIVRDDAGSSDILMQTSDTTWQAYNRWGGWSLYTSTSGGARANKVSYNRPIDSRTSCCPTSFVFGIDNSAIRFIERNGYAVSYFSGIDTDRRGSLLKRHKVFMSVGHDEYWSGAQRANVEAARDAGVHLAFFGGNDMFWRTRWESSVDGRGDAYRTLVAYKDTLADAKLDPSGEWTGTWRDPRFTNAPNGHLPENALIGTEFTVNCCAGAITVPASQNGLRFWRNTPLAGASGTTTLADQTLGFEWNSDVDNGYRPVGLVRMSTTTVAGSTVLQDFGKSYGPGTATHSLTLYRAASGALVFSAGSMQFVWGLDASHDPPTTATDPNLQQAVINLLADMGVQPATLMSGRVAATASTDTAGPSSSVSSGATTVGYGNAVTVQGTASDPGGKVAGVEVSFDGGNRWYAANGTTNWNLSWNANRAGAGPVLVRAVDDSGNLGATTTGPTITVNCPCSIFDAATTPNEAVSSDTGSVELGVKFRTTTDGVINGVRVYRGAANAGTRTGTIWSAAGQNLGEVTFANNPTTGWQTATFSSPIAVTANTTYVASVYFPSGGYADTPQALYLYNPTTASSPVQGLASGTDGGNGVFRYGGHLFPTQTNNAMNYFVDAAFTPSGSPLPPTTTTAAPTTTTTTAAPTTTTVPVSGSCPCTVFGSTVPANASASDTGSVELGMRFRVSQSMNATAVRFYKSTLNTGTHVGSLWTSTGTKLASVTFTGESASGWQSMNFASPVALTANTTYVVSVLMPKGGYAYALGAFSGKGAGSPPLQALADGVDGPNGVYGYSASSAFPNRSFQSANYYVDVTVTNPTSTTTTVAPTTTTTVAPTTTTAPIASTATMFANTATPATASASDTGSVALGVKFRVDVAGSITAVRFYKGPLNSGTHVGSLWTSAGTQLASATFSNETASGWQEVTFATPVSVQPGITYVASVYMPNGGYAYTLSGFVGAGAGSGAIHALADGVDGFDGIYLYAVGNAFPTRGFMGTNYWIDARFKAG